jgi:hypothetical protein
MLTDRDYQLLSDYLDEALSSSERAALETRLGTDDELRGEYEALRQTVTLIQALPVRKAPRDFTLNAAQARRPAQRLWLSPTFVSGLSAAAAMLLIGFGLLSLISSASRAPLVPQQSVGEASGALALQPTQINLEKTDVDLLNTEVGNPLPPQAPGAAGTNLPPPTSILNVPSGGGETGDTFFNEPSATLVDEEQLFSSSAAQDTQPVDDGSAANSTTTQELEIGGFNGLSETIPPSEESNIQDAAVAEAPSSLAFQGQQAKPSLETTGDVTALRIQETATAFSTATQSPTSTATATAIPVTATVTLETNGRLENESASPPLNSGMILIAAGAALLALAAGVYLRGRRR